MYRLLPTISVLVMNIIIIIKSRFIILILSSFRIELIRSSGIHFRLINIESGRHYRLVVAGELLGRMYLAYLALVQGRQLVGLELEFQLIIVVDIHFPFVTTR